MFFLWYFARFARTLLEKSSEDRLHLENSKKNKFSFGILLDLHYLCSRKENIWRLLIAI